MLLLLGLSFRRKAGQCLQSRLLSCHVPQTVLMFCPHMRVQTALEECDLLASSALLFLPSCYDCVGVSVSCCVYESVPVSVEPQHNDPAVRI
jgi:hypothetical protein